MEKLINMGSKPTKEMLRKAYDSLGSEYKTLALQFSSATRKKEKTSILKRMRKINSKLLIIEGDLFGDL